MARADKPLKGGRTLIYRHPFVVRASHWVNVLCLAVLLMSGLQILNAHPAFYIGEDSRFAAPVASIRAVTATDGSARGVLRVGSARVETTGVLGVSKGADGMDENRAFPRWTTIPGYKDLGAGRRWHFFFAWVFAINGALWVAWTVLSGRLAGLWPSWRQLKGIGHTIVDHALLRFPRGDEARRYNVLQKLAYIVVLFVLLPLMVETGLAMSPGMDAAFPWLTGVWGGRQTARLVHFVTASGLVGFLVIHLIMVVLAGPIHEMRAILTGWLVIKPEKPT